MSATCNVQPKNQTVSSRMSSAEEVVLAAAACVILSKCKRPRRYWVRPSLQARARYSGSDLLNDLNRDDTDPLTGELRCDGSIKNFLRMSSDDFESLIVGIGHIISKQDTNYRKAIPVRERLAITLRFLASGDSYTSLSYLFKVSKSAISILVPEVCEAVIGFLKDNIQVSKERKLLNIVIFRYLLFVYVVH